MTQKPSLQSVVQLDPLTVLRVATTAEFQRLNAVIRQMEKRIAELERALSGEKEGK